MTKCKGGTELKLCDFKMPKPDPEEVKRFIELFGKKMKKNQIELLELFAEKIYGFRLESHNVEVVHDRFNHWMNGGSGHTCIFRFDHDGVKGEITIYI